MAAAGLLPPLLRVLALWRHRTGWLLLGIVVSLAALLAGLALLTLSGAWIAAVLTATVLAAPLLLRLAGGLRVVLRYLERLTTHAATFRALADLRVWFFRGLAARSAGGLGFRRAGDVLARLVGDVEALDGLYLRILVPLAGALVLLPVLALVTGWERPWRGLGVGVLFALAGFVLPRRGARLAARAGDTLAAEAAALRVAALDAISGLREVRAFGAEGRVLAEIQTREAALLVTQRGLAQRVARANAAALLCGQGALLLVLLLAGTHPLVEVAAAFLVVAGFEAAGGLPRAGVLAGHAAAAARRVLEAAEGPLPVPDPPVPAPLPRGNDLCFSAVRFRWRPDLPPLFDGLTLEVPAGARIAVLGPSGAGKSSLAALALKLAVPEAGRITLGGTDLAQLGAAELRGRIAWLSQATHLFDDTIRANLLLGRPEASETELWQALDRAAIGDMVRALPEGLDTWLGEGGARVSGGQGRRIALARTLLSPAPILILDEPAAGLDAETERAFLATLNEVDAGRSVILIAHRLVGVERLDRIYRISGGHAVAAMA